MRCDCAYNSMRNVCTCPPYPFSTPLNVSANSAIVGTCCPALALRATFNKALHAARLAVGVPAFASITSPRLRTTRASRLRCAVARRFFWACGVALLAAIRHLVEQ
jgi:hypothetical protein